MAHDPNCLMRIEIVGDDIETWVKRDIEWTDRYTNALLDVVLSDRFRNSLFRRIIEDSSLRNEIYTRINNRKSIAG